MLTRAIAVASAIVVTVPFLTRAGDEPASGPTREQLIPAVQRGVQLISKSAKNYPTNRTCFGCHNQTLPLLGILRARDAGLQVDASLPGEIIEFIGESFQSKLADIRNGKGVGGRGLTAGYALWTFELAGAEPNDVTEAMVAYLLKVQERDGHYRVASLRPPGEESLFMSTAMAAAGMKKYATEAQREAANVAIDKARDWMLSTPIEFHEDRVALLWGLRRLGANEHQIARARDGLLEKQRPDGGWRQLPELESDAYATATALYVLLDTGSPAGDTAVVRAVEFLLKTQLEDGSWHVKTRAKPVQEFFDNGDPHGKDQFISMTATGWATGALARVLKDR